ncbi:KOW domain-containing RNA-binding protein [Bariatricus massiliensis]|uniref:KOW domain-containing RNA-binding protein n=1 Tax=Bariatricus massiliensis TaxID=1745713 RepID=A0ABS8DH12_9FIRM|nr:KOW domain-containing RNA-binding protein [Bariatricus massiliensis]MCB7304344.1 KOW domain-containing RNA-binding protein [Bariatricus massiliensis]MCB7374995.1 KOW domain-containing RNA-binding protein [Bariatricus massiliensis]MCB7387454.1 KOW domain-containing RNA-binding protein [Bariatricus massiliensis]MCB7411616.1 KOW domain-containing RNA-binding protein [Bariatricus massiliensis]MCQ5253751.1 KOW domain-containing RNA-binding protein [Bariatricus massiliensis]
MDRWEKGMLAKSLAGHDSGKIYVIIDLDETYVYLADGKIRTLAKLKKKKRKHVQLIRRQYEIEAADDVRIKRILKEYENQKAGMKEEN